MKRRTLLAAAAVAAVAGHAQEVPSPSQERLQRLLQAGQPGVRASPVTPQQLALRDTLLVQGEAALARRDAAAALVQFERAALILHAADTEMGLVRGYMQGGDYRRALAFGAHAAGAHLDVVGGTALYAWLLHAGGQEAVAQQLLQQAQARNPQQPLLQAVRHELGRPWPRAVGAELLSPPIRLAPYAVAVAGARVIGTATLVRGGHAALAPVASLRGKGRLWVRNGLGDTVAARPSGRAAFEGLQELLLEAPLPAPQWRSAARDPFPGSVALAVEFAPHPSAVPAWPLLKTGFVGAALPAAGVRRLGVVLPAGGARGGPVFDQQGALAGIAVAAADGDRLVGGARLLAWAGQDLVDAPAGEVTAGALAADAVYERSLRSALQLLRT